MTAAFTFTKAVKQQEKLRLALDGPAGSGKTWTALIIATDLAARMGGRVAVIDSERSSARKYASDFDFDHLTLPDWSPHTYMGAVRAAADGGYAVIVIDSFSHAWEGVLELKDNATARSKSKNSYTEGWREATPVHNELVDTVLRAEAHVIATLRTKTEYVINDDKSISKVGLKPIQREGVDFEFDVVGDMTAENSMVISKTRCSALAGQVIRRPDVRLAEILWTWLNDGEPAIPEADADRIAGVLNAMGKEAKQAWLDRFGMKPRQLGVSRLAEANAFIANLADPDGGVRMALTTDGQAPPSDPETDPDPGDGPGGGTPDAGGPADGDAVDSNGSDPHGPEQGEYDSPPAPATRQQDTVGWKDLATEAGKVFKDDYDAAPRGSKGRIVERLRHALIYACTGGATASAKGCTAEQLFKVRNSLGMITRGEITYEIQPGDEGGVTWISASGKRTTVMWAEAEMAGTEGAAA